MNVGAITDVFLNIMGIEIVAIPCTPHGYSYIHIPFRWGTKTTSEKSHRILSTGKVALGLLLLLIQQMLIEPSAAPPFIHELSVIGFSSLRSGSDDMGSKRGAQAARSNTSRP